MSLLINTQKRPYIFVLSAYDPPKDKHAKTRPFYLRQFESKLLFFFSPLRLFHLSLFKEAGRHQVAYSLHHKKEGIHHKDCIVRNFSNTACNRCYVVNEEECAYQSRSQRRMAWLLCLFPARLTTDTNLFEFCMSAVMRLMQLNSLIIEVTQNLLDSC